MGVGGSQETVVPSNMCRSAKSTKFSMEILVFNLFNQPLCTTEKADVYPGQKCKMKPTNVSYVTLLPLHYLHMYGILLQCVIWHCV